MSKSIDSFACLLGNHTNRKGEKKKKMDKIKIEKK